MADNIIKDYTDLALKTELKDYMIKLIPVQFRKLHATMGISTEIAELVGSKDGVNTAEEIGDVFYYIAILCKVLNIEFDELLNNTKADCSQEVQALSLCIIWSGELLDLSKKEIFYKKKIDDEKFIEILKKVVAFLQAFIHLKSLKLENVLFKNIAKLEKRYGGSFSIDKAINRDLEAELKILSDTDYIDSVSKIADTSHNSKNNTSFTIPSKDAEKLKNTFIIVDGKKMSRYEYLKQQLKDVNIVS